MDFYDDVPRHKKKKSQKSKAKMRSDHKHEYEKIIINSMFGWKWGKRCVICGRIDEGHAFSSRDKEDFLKPDLTKSNNRISFRDYLSIQEIEEKFPHIPIFKMRDPKNGDFSYMQVGGFNKENDNEV